MKMCWPRRDQSTYKESPTDYFYADLTGNWDLDGDTYYGEYDHDGGTGGVDWANEVYVGRIPVYGADYGTLDAILQKTMDYEAACGNLNWRKSALLPMAFSDASTDGAYLGEAIRGDYLSPNGFAAYTLYQHKTSGCTSTYASDENLVGGAVRTHWAAQDYGLVTWWGHGSETGARIGYTEPPYFCQDGVILQTSDCLYLDDDRPAFVYQCSCSNGYPELSTNLGYALLKNGAIATVSASRVSWYAVTSWHTGLWPYADNASIGYYYDEGLVVAGDVAGESLFNVKSWMGPSSQWGGTSWMNLMDFNLYGDPSIGLRTDQPIPAIADGLAAVAVSPERIHLSWNDNSTNECGFRIERSPNGFTGWVEIQVVGANVTAYADTGLDWDTTYHYRVRSYNNTDTSGYGNPAQARTWSEYPHAAYVPLALRGYSIPGE
jgi:hypothetical protein